MRRGAPEDPATPCPPTLGCRVVRYDGRPDRVTVFPERADDVARLSRWLTVDAGAVVDLHAVR